jgi:hypothetical protein
VTITLVSAVLVVAQPARPAAAESAQNTTSPQALAAAAQSIQVTTTSVTVPDAVAAQQTRLFQLEDLSQKIADYRNQEFATSVGEAIDKGMQYFDLGWQWMGLLLSTQQAKTVAAQGNVPPRDKHEDDQPTGENNPDGSSVQLSQAVIDKEVKQLGISVSSVTGEPVPESVILDLLNDEINRQIADLQQALTVEGFSPGSATDTHPNVGSSGDVAAFNRMFHKEWQDRMNKAYGTGPATPGDLPVNLPPPDACQDDPSSCFTENGDHSLVQDQKQPPAPADIPDNVDTGNVAGPSLPPPAAADVCSADPASCFTENGDHSLVQDQNSPANTDPTGTSQDDGSGGDSGGSD